VVKDLGLPPQPFADDEILYLWAQNDAFSEWNRPHEPSLKKRVRTGSNQSLPAGKDVPLALDLGQIDGERERLGGLPHIRRSLDRANHRDAVHPGPNHRAGIRDVDAADAD
jgi:hypothetical protein